MVEGKEEVHANLGTLLLLKLISRDRALSQFPILSRSVVVTCYQLETRMPIRVKRDIGNRGRISSLRIISRGNNKLQLMIWFVLHVAYYWTESVISLASAKDIGNSPKKKNIWTAGWRIRCFIPRTLFSIWTCIYMQSQADQLHFYMKNFGFKPYYCSRQQIPAERSVII